MKSFFLIATLAAMFAAPMANAGFYGQLNVAPIFSGDKDGTPAGDIENANASTLGFDAGATLGWAFFGKLLVGGTANYSSASITQEKTTADTGLDSKRTYFEAGPTLGFLLGGLHANFTYFLTAKYTVDAKSTNTDGSTSSDTTHTYNSTSGLQADVGYAFHVAPKFKIGPSIVWKQVSYKEDVLKNNVSGAETTTSYAVADKVKANTSVMLTAVFEF